jgi:RecJ-like exonuclease
MSLAPCQVCGGTGFIDAPAPNPDSVEQDDEQLVDDALREPALGDKIPCPVCAGSGSNTGL